jgi:hypothetical protein
MEDKLSAGIALEWARTAPEQPQLSHSLSSKAHVPFKHPLKQAASNSHSESSDHRSEKIFTEHCFAPCMTEYSLKKLLISLDICLPPKKYIWRGKCERRKGETEEGG